MTIRASDGDLAGQPALRLDVADIGPGISDTDAHHILTDYVSRFRERDGAGTGLGLGIIRKAVLNLGGRIDLQSTPGEGTTFRAFIPRATEAATIDAAPPAVEDGQGAAPPEQARSCRGRNVLLIEDHATNRELPQGMLATIGCTVTAADDGLHGLQGLRIAQESSFDLVLTDLNMPGLSGETVARCLRHPSVSGDAYIIAVTAKATMSQVDRESIIAGGTDAFLFKPFDSARLEDVICDALEERAMGDDIFDETDATDDPDMLARSAQDLRRVQALLPADRDPAEAPDLDALGRMAHHAGGALLCIGHARLGHALLELERRCGSHVPEALRGMTLVLGVEIKRFLARTGAPIVPG